MHLLCLTLGEAGPYCIQTALYPGQSRHWRDPGHGAEWTSWPSTADTSPTSVRCGETRGIQAVTVLELTGIVWWGLFRCHGCHGPSDLLREGFSLAMLRARRQFPPVFDSRGATHTPDSRAFNTLVVRSECLEGESLFMRGSGWRKGLGKTEWS